MVVMAVSIILVAFLMTPTLGFTQCFIKRAVLKDATTFKKEQTDLLYANAKIQIGRI